MPYRQKRSAADKAQFPHLAWVKDRHGKHAPRCYYRWKGRTVRIYSDMVRQPDAFRVEYDAAVAGKPVPAGVIADERPRRSTQGTWNAALDDYQDTADWHEKAPNTKRAYEPWIETLREVFGPEQMSKTTRWQVFQLHNAVVKSGRKVQANTFLSVLSRVVHIGRLHDWVKGDLLLGIEHQDIVSNSYRPYGDDEVAAWRSTHAVGTMARAAFEFAYQLAMANSDLITFCPADIVDGALWKGRRKTGGVQTQRIDVDPIMRDVLAAFADGDSGTVDLQGRSIEPFLRNQLGKPFASDTFRKQWRRWAVEAGLPEDFKIHGARATFVVDAQDAGVNNHDIMNVTGHSDERTLKIYGKKHNKTRAGSRAQSAVLVERARRSGGKAGLRVVA